MAEERISSRRRARLNREELRIAKLRPEVAAWELHVARRALFGHAGPVAARKARVRYTPEVLALLDVRAADWREWASLKNDARFRPAGVGFPYGSFYLDDVLFVNRTQDAPPFLFELDRPTDLFEERDYGPD
jgi:hypothetical protein